MKTWQSVLIGFLLGSLASGVIFFIARNPRGHPVELIPPPTLEPILVYVTGEVNLPGVYTLPPNSRVIDAIQAAGNFSLDANKDAVNLAKKLNDGELIIIPEKVPTATPIMQISDVQSYEDDSQFEAFLENPININLASQEELQLLPDIGPSKADQIIKYRETHGEFTHIEEVQNVLGIGSKLYENIKPYITIGN